MKRRTIAPLTVCLVLAAAMGAAAEESVLLRDPERLTGTVQAQGRDVRVVWPFGSVTMPAEACGPSSTPGALRNGAAEAIPSESQETLSPLRVKATTRGDFTVRYELVREKDAISARQVKVSVKNRIEFLAPPSPILKEHEETHRNINFAGARRIESELSVFRAPAALGLPSAEKRFRKIFLEKIDGVEALHRAWDGTHKVP